MTIIEFIPRVGINDIQFGMTRKMVRDIMIDKYRSEEPYLKGEDTDCYLQSSLQFSFESDGTLSFIEASSAPPVAIKLLNMNTWEIDGEDLLNYLKTIDKINEGISKGESNPIFENNIITLWDLDEQYDHFGEYKNKKWGTIGIGDERYFQRIIDIYKKYNA